jgi:hypothetical protein
MGAAPRPPLTTGRNPRLAKEGFKTFQGLAADERAMLITAIESLYWMSYRTKW